MARSPILQSITALTWRPDFDSRVPHRRLRIVSDLLQHEPGGYSQYRNGDLWLDFAERPLSAQTEAHLDGVDVVIDYLPRPESALYQSTAHRAFWRRWLMARGAAGLHFQAMAQVKPRFADTAKEDDDAR